MGYNKLYTKSGDKIMFITTKKVFSLAKKFSKSPNEILDIARVCDEFDMEIEKVFELANLHGKSTDAILDAVKICDKYDVEQSWCVFRLIPEELEESIQILIENGFDPNNFHTGLKTKPEKLRKIIEICKENNIEITPRLVELTTPSNLIENINYIRENYGNAYIISAIVMRDPKKLKESMPVYKELGLLRYTRLDASVFDLTREEIIDRTGVITYLGDSLYRIGQKTRVDRINHIYTLSKKSFESYCELNAVSETIRKANYERVVRIMKAFEARKKSVK